MTCQLPAGLYPQYCLRLSPTFNTWCLLHVSDVHTLSSVPDFEVQGFYFYKNLPIKWVRVVGIVVAVDDIAGLRIYSLDDGSGACIECVVSLKSCRAPPDTNIPANDPKDLLGKRPQPMPPADCADVEVGSVLDIKGKLTTFREEMQIKIEKVKMLRSTQQEVLLWERRSQFRDEVLNQPWVLSEKQIQRCKREEMRGEGCEEERRRKKEKRREEKRQEQKRLREAEEEERRRKQASPVVVMERYRDIKRKKKQAEERWKSSSSSTLLRHVLDDSIRGKYSALGL
ncbi:Protein stn1 [Colletotrichum sidae]|uniref:Protein stn1 n=1 Tax=Colletotrichum sidae TaxID=1347389 RepID=A0A4R8TR57_9PEZI|nr:Protein stn1 [Colletotrichum sidae]